MASSFLKDLVTDYNKLGYQLWHRPLKMASLVYEREIGIVVQYLCQAFFIISELLPFITGLVLWNSKRKNVIDGKEVGIF